MATWTADRRIYLTRDGRAVERGDPDAAFLLVPAGGVLPLERARALGLVPDDAPPPAPAGKPRPANRAKAAPANKARAEDQEQ